MVKNARVISVNSSNENFKSLLYYYMDVLRNGDNLYLVFESKKEYGKKFIRVNNIDLIKLKCERYLVKTDIANFLVEQIKPNKNLVNEFTDLENGMSIMLRNQEEYIYVDHQFYDKNFILTDLGFFKNDFTHCDSYMEDIIIVYNCEGEEIWCE